ncbi:30S ribosomal protein S8e [archaeon]|jgi:small subunit ribosomal protein S8e|nr:30S ribosomal protein S8e [archaeon]MBT6697619.1 30S ribosomal protein S8e [archaeon]
MANSMHRANRKPSGGRFVDARKKRKKELVRFPAMTKVAEETRAKVIRVAGGNKKRVLLAGNQVNVIKKDGKAEKTVIKTVLENTANPNLVRRNILTKGAVVETTLGKVKITSRPGHDGCLNGVQI